MFETVGSRIGRGKNNTRFSPAFFRSLPASLRRKTINGSFNINQRVVSGTVTLAAGAFGHDRWKGGASGATYTFSTTAGVTTLNISAGSLVHVVKGSNLASGIHVLSWSGTAQGKIDTGSFGALGITGTATGGTNVTLEFGTGTLSQVQLEPGNTPTPFEQWGDEFELSRCLDYYRKSYGYAVVPGSAVQTAANQMANMSADGIPLICNQPAGAGTRNSAAVQFDKPMIGTPTVRYWDLAGNASKLTTGNSTNATTHNDSTDAFRSIFGYRSGVAAQAGPTGSYQWALMWDAVAEL